MTDSIVACEAPECDGTWQDQGDGKRFCGPTCRQRAKRARERGDEMVTMPEDIRRMKDQLLWRRRR